MRGAWVAGALAAVASFAAASVASATIAIRCGSLIDGKGDAVRKNVTIVIEGERIAAIRDGAGPDRADTAQVIDLSSDTCLPGLIDTHTHVLLQGDITADDYDKQLL